MKTFFAILFTIFISSTVFGTAQYPDKIIYNGKIYRLHSNPMESYFEKYPDKRPERGIMSTALWRGYVATFEIKDNQLYLKDIEIIVRDTTSKENYKTKWESVLNETFPNQELMKIDWMTGLLVLPYGKMVNYVHMGYGSTYKRYILLEIEKGNLKKEKQFGYKQYEKFKEKQFHAFKETEEYEKIKTEIKEEEEGDYNDEFIDSFLRNFIIEYTSKILIK